ncbi:efflux RND transporter permease subunit [Terrilactibacillus laevilacticus]|uniref:Efflux RND transporter permease subunit n=1 Tax=Terrilactibacillus laevilacticus TaxID=1380157 RepID=A0ABW5PNL6_9BACI|nr:efflux RND transporter permease subunit [Terrilactibacillus laevilacticus]
MGSWIKFSLKNAAVIIIAMIFITVGGLYSIKAMKMEAMPNIDVPYLVVSIPYEGATPEQALEDIGKPLEQSLSNINKLKNLYIESHSNVAVAILEFDMDKKMEDAEKDVTTSIASTNLPDGAGKPQIQKQGPAAMPVFTFSVSAKDVSSSDLTQFVNEELKPTMAQVDGVGSIDIYGDTDKQINITLDSKKMKQKGITYDAVKQTIQANNFSFPAGQVDINRKTLNVQSDYKLQSLEDVKAIELLGQGPSGVQKAKLSDIAKVMYGSKKETVYTRLNQKPAILVGLKAQTGANTVDIVSGAKKKLSDLDLPKGYEITPLSDNAKDIKHSVYSMLREVLLGTLFAVIVTFVFLRNIRATIVAVLSIPLSILAAMITMKFLDYSLNMMTLAGIAVAVGRVIDDSIVVIENIYRRTSTSIQRSEQMVLTAAKEVGGAVTSSTLTTIAVFGPLSFVPGVIGKFFAPFGITVIVALAFSLIVSMTIVPLLAKFFLLKIKHKEQKESSLHKFYKGTLNVALRHKAITIIFSIIVLVGSFALVPAIPKNFMPADKATSYKLTADLPIGSSLSETNKLAEHLETIIQNEKHVKYIQTYVKGEAINLTIDLNKSITVNQSKSFEKQVRNQLKSIDKDTRVSFTPVDITGGDNSFALIVDGSNKESLAEAGDKIVKELKGINGLSNIKTNLSGVEPQLKLDIDGEKAADKGLNPIAIASFIRSVVAGENVTNAQMNGKTTSVQLELSHDPIHSIKNLSDLSMTNSMGQQIKISDVATFNEKPGPSGLYRLNQQEYVEVSGRFTTDNVSGVQAEIDKHMKSIKLPAGVKTHSEGSAQMMNEGTNNMMIAMGIAVVLVFIVMLITFGNLLAPVAILTSLPFIFTGGLLGLFLTKKALGMPALVGFLMLIGIVVTNAIVLMDRAIQNEKKGMQLTSALLEAGVTRLRPILMTALATIGALLPLALSTEGGLISNALAIVVISGLLTSTLLTLVIVPTVYHILKSTKQRLSRRNKKNDQKEVSA